MRKRVTAGIIGIFLGLAAYFGIWYYSETKGASSIEYQTVELERGTLTAIVGATGTVRSNQTTTVSWQASGRIGEIFIHIDSIVQKGQRLAKLADNALPQSIILAQSDLITAERNLEDLYDTDLQLALAHQDLVNAQKQLEDAQENRERKDYERASATTIDEAQANYLMAQNAYEDAQEDYKPYEGRPEDDPIRAHFLSKMANAKRERDRALANLNWLLGAPDEMEVALADVQIEVAEANLRDAQKKYDDILNGPDPDDVTIAEVRIESIESTLNMVWIEAPIDGTITEILSKEGDQVNPGTVSFRIDDLSRLLVDVEIPEVDINRIEIGQLATLSFDAILGKEYAGKVVEVPRVGTNVQGVVNYLITVELLDADENILPGMTAAVNIIVQELEDVLLIPNRAVRLLEGNRVVYVLRNGTQVAVKIELGATSDVNSQIISGDLKAGDLIILNPQIEQWNMMGPPPGLQ